VPIIDCNTLLGSWPHSEVDLSLEALAAAMQARGVGRSLVTHTTAVFYDMQIGNDLVVQLARQHQPVLPVAVINPLRYPACLEEIERRLQQGVRVFRFSPGEHGYPFAPNVGPLREALRQLEAAKLLLVDVTGVPAPVVGSGIDELLPVPTAFTVDAEGLGTILHAGKLGPNVWVETSRLESGGTIEAAVTHLGANRVLFGSGAPLRSLASAVRSLQFVEMSDADRQAIFEGNAQRALS
jgi:predicted TIM-barrel fold metal-dependent hydrolase